jgi:hypothetical protein
MNQLIQANIPAWRLLADQLGVTEAKARQLAETGKISGADASAAIIAGMSQYPNLMDQLTKTFAGKLENLRDTFNQEIAGIGTPLFQELSRAVDLASEALASPKFKQAAEDMVSDLTAITRAVETVGEALGKIPLPVLEALFRPSGAIAAANLITRFVPRLTGFGDFATQHPETGLPPDQPVIAPGAATSDTGNLPISGAGFLQQRAASGVMADLTNQVRTGAITADQARQQWRALSDTFGALYSNASDLSQIFSRQLNQALDDHITQVNTATAAHEHLQETLAQAGQAQALGASSEQVGRAYFGVTGTGAQATPEQVQQAKQAIQELTTAYQRAASVIGTVDLSHGIAGFAAVAPDLARARDSLRDLGQTNQALDTLASLAARFKEVADATDAATTAYRGFMLTLSETDQKIQQLTSFRARVTGAVSDADRRRSLGIATPEDLQLLNNYQNILANIDRMKGGLQQSATGDILGIAANYPDLKKSDDTLREMIGQVGGPRQLVIDVKTNTDQALEQINDLLTKPHQAVIDVALAVHLTGLPPALANALASAAGGIPAGATGDSGYARPPTQRLVGGGPYGSGTLYQPGGAIGGEGGGGFNQYAPLSQGQFSQIAGSAPYATAEGYAGLIAAAQKYNVDPRVLLAFIRNENVAPALAAVNNFGGIKGSGGPGSPEGDTYAAYGSPQDFFTALARLLTSGSYGADFRSGNLAAVRQRYVAGSATPSAEQQANIANTVASYATLAQQYPASSAGGVITPELPGASVLTSRVSLTQPTPIQAGAGQTVTPNQVAAMRKRANELAGSAYVYGGGHSSQDAGGFDCSGYVIEVLRAGGINAPFTDAGGLYKWAQTEEGARLLDAAGIQLGFYNPGAGGVNEHVGINIGGEWFESGGQRGDTAGPSPNAAQGFNKFVGTPRAIAGVSGPGVALVQTTGAAGASTTDLTATVQSGTAPASVGGTALRETLAGLDPKDAQAALAAYQQMLPIFQQLANTKFPDEPFRAADVALQQGVGFLQTWGDALATIRTGSGEIVADQQKISETIGGPVADALNAQLSAMKDIKDTQDQINALTERKAQLQQQQSDEQAQNAADDRARARQQTLDQRGQQDQDRARQRGQTLEQRQIQDERDAIQQRWQNEQTLIQEQNRLRQVSHQLEMRRIEDETIAENDRYTASSNAIADQERALQHFGTQVRQGLQDQRTGLDTAYTNQTAIRSAQGQLFTAQARGATTNAGANAAGLAAAVLADTQAKADELYKKQSADLQKAMDQEDKAAADQLYNLETERISQDRQHQQILENIANQSTAMQRAWEDESNRLADQDASRQISHQQVMQLWAEEDKQRQRQSEDEQFNIETTRLAASRASEDEQFNIETERLARQKQFADAQKAIDAEIAAQQQLQQGEQERLQTAQAALSAWQQVDSSVLSNVTGGGGTPPAKALGGTVHGWGIVGDSPSGDMSAAEAVYGTYTVVSHAESVARGLIPRFSVGTGFPSAVAVPTAASDGMTVGGDTYQITLNASGNRTTDEELFRRLTAWVVARDRAKDIQLSRNGIAARAAAQGQARY